MTPAQLEVERDRLLEGGRTPETAGMMQAAAAGELQLRVAVTVREALVQRLVEARRDAGAWVGVPVSMDSVLEMATDIVGRVDLTPIVERLIVERLLPPESAGGASASRPSGETP